MIKKLCLSAILILSLFVNVHAQITAFDFNGILTLVTTVNATTTIANTSTSIISRGSGITATSLSNAFAGSGWDATSAALAIAGNDYFEFTIAANSTYKVSLSALEANFRRSSTGPMNFQWRYSINGGTSFVDIGTPITYALNNTNGDAQTSINLSTINDLQNVANPTTIIFRLYGWGGAIGGTFATTGINLGSASIPTSVKGALSSAGTLTASGNLLMNGTASTNYIQFPDGTKQYTAGGGGGVCGWGGWER
jgi:hypothetical protein